MANSIHAYAARAALLRQQALAQGSVCYLDVIEAAYGPDAIGPDVIDAKAQWRTAAPAPFYFLADYATALDPATVASLKPVADPKLKSTLVAQYESKSHCIGLSPLASDVAIFHESGHALQRATLLTGTMGKARRPGTSELFLMHEGSGTRADATTLRRLEYLCSQIELEVRLQDLNRFHALLHDGRPVMDEWDALRALTALGLSISYEDCRDAFALAGRELTAEQFAAAIAPIPPDLREITAVFEDARELRMVRRLALRVAPDCWVTLLAKILFEAPGHL